jgi:hypothetical protein
VRAVLVTAVAVGAFEDQQVRTLGRNEVRQNRRVGRPQIATEHDALAACPGGDQLQLDICRPEHMPGWLQAHLAFTRIGFMQGEPVIIRKGNDALLYDLDVALQLFSITANGQAERVLKHYWQQPGRRLAAQDRPVEACRQQIRDTSDMVNVDVGHD